ncbi:beta-glucosidase BglX [Novosphingobium sp. ST904]|uniref:beta-glucosidase BglX n=1 Tax=Novosphingobium sp. ST904 TaxID=1684385 RepID=UPI0010473804|nr:beta-glucosidase BglX [Novosphingobium sp. ST904]TCM23706.1 beta-glucosidase [Novosphingobium sp. ST904]
MGVGKRASLLAISWLLAASAVTPAVADAPLEEVTTARAQRQLDARIRRLLAQMTPEEKAAQLLTAAGMNIANAPDHDTRARSGVGSIFFVSKPAEINRLQKLALDNSRLKIPILFGYDVLHGLKTVFPVPIGLAASWDPELIEQTQAAAAGEARGVGIGWVFGPMLDVTRDPRWGRIVEGPGEDPYLASAIARAQVRGLQGPQLGTPGRVVAGAKHFAGYGAGSGGRDYDEANVSDAELWNVYLPPFRAAIDAGAGNVMAAYMPLNGIPAAGNHWLLNDVLRGQLGFKGWVVSDNQAVRNLLTHGFARDRSDAAERALNAGTDMEMATGLSNFQELPASLSAGRISGKRLNEAVARVLAVKFRLGLFDHPYVDEKAASDGLASRESLDLAVRAAERSAVLLRNENGLLPLDRTKIHSIAVIGPLGGSTRDPAGPWVFAENEPVLQSLADGLRQNVANGIEVSYAPGVTMPRRLIGSPIEMMDRQYSRPAPADDDSGIAQATALARSSDVAILVLGEGQNMIGEMGSRSSLDLPGRQQDLLDSVLATGKPVVVVLMNGRPLTLRGNLPPAILELWYPGSQGGTALSRLLFGDAVPGGKLPYTWPRSAGQIPTFYAHLTTHDPKGSERRYWDDPSSPVYPFGFGLSYTTFSYKAVQLDHSTIRPGASLTTSVQVTNSGPRAGDEVVQLYLHQRSGSSARPVRELKGFRRIHLDAGETRTVSFEISPEQLRYWNAAARDWMIDNSTFDVAIGTDSMAPFSASFNVER